MVEEDEVIIFQIFFYAHYTCGVLMRELILKLKIVHNYISIKTTLKIGEMNCTVYQSVLYFCHRVYFFVNLLPVLLDM